MSDGLSCKELVELVTDYLEGSLPTDERARFEEHLRDCEGCQNYLDQIERTIDLARVVDESSLPPDAWAELLHAFRSWKQS